MGTTIERDQNGEHVSHTGPVQIRARKDWITVLCPAGHLVTGHGTDRKSGFAGSAFQAKVSWHQHGADPWIVTCHGMLRDV